MTDICPRAKKKVKGVQAIELLRIMYIIYLFICLFIRLVIFDLDIIIIIEHISTYNKNMTLIIHNAEVKTNVNRFSYVF